jgi:hypothetical protein
MKEVEKTSIDKPLNRLVFRKTTKSSLEAGFPSTLAPLM